MKIVLNPVGVYEYMSSTQFYQFTENNPFVWESMYETEFNNVTQDDGIVNKFCDVLTGKFYMIRRDAGPWQTQLLKETSKSYTEGDASKDISWAINQFNINSQSSSISPALSCNPINCSTGGSGTSPLPNLPSDVSYGGNSMFGSVFCVEEFPVINWNTGETIGEIGLNGEWHFVTSNNLNNLFGSIGSLNNLCCATNPGHAAADCAGSSNGNGNGNGFSYGELDNLLLGMSLRRIDQDHDIERYHLDPKDYFKIKGQGFVAPSSLNLEDGLYRLNFIFKDYIPMSVIFEHDASSHLPITNSSYVNLNVFPNPIENNLLEFEIESEKRMMIDVQVLNLNGELLHKEKKQIKENAMLFRSIDVSGAKYPSDNLILKLTFQDGSSIQRNILNQN